MSEAGKPLLKKEVTVDETEPGRENADEKTSSLEAFFTIFNFNVGTGILAMPYVIKLTGYWGVFLIILVAVLANYTGKLLIYCLHESTSYEDLQATTYADLGGAFWPRYGRVLVHITNLIEQFSHCTLFLIMCGLVMNLTFPDSGVSESCWITIFSLAVLPVAFVRTMKHVNLVSVLTVTVAMGSSTCVLIHSLSHFASWNTHNMASFDIKQVSIALGIITVTFSSQAYLPIIERSMQYPGEFNGIMDFTYILVTIVKYNYGILVYFCFGQDTEQVMTLSMPHGPLRTALSVAVITTALLFYVVPMFTLYDIFEKQLSIPLLLQLMDAPLTCKPSARPKALFRFGTIIMSTIVAIFVPHFGLLMAFVGSFTGTLLVLIYPCVFHVKLHYSTLPWYHILFDLAIALFGVVACILGTVYSSLQIAEDYDFDVIWGIEPDE